MNVYDTIKKELEEIVGKTVSFSLSQSEDFSHGDYATNVAFPLSKQKGLSPKVCAEELIPVLTEKLSSFVEKIEVAGPGFINFFLKPEIIRKENNGNVNEGITKYTGKNILVEHSSPNLFKPFSVGHLMNNIVGEFVARAMDTLGGNVRTMSFPSDVSLGIAKALFIIEKDIKDGKIDSTYFEHNHEDEVIKYLGEAYVRGVKECEENEESLAGAKKVLDKIYVHNNNGDDQFYALILEIRKINENYFKKVLIDLGSKVDVFVYESLAGIKGEKIVKENIGKVFTESEGAIVYLPSEDRKDINTSVFINSQGYPTYEAKDLGLMQIKFKQLEKFTPDVSLFITDQEQASHFKVVLDAASKLGDDWKDMVSKSIHVPHGRMLFKGQKMSSRLGGVPLALDVIGVVEEEVRERSGEKIAYLGDDEKKKLEKEIALSALRIAVLRSKPGININFDPEISLSFEGDSGPYLLYTHARCFSLLEKGGGIIPAWGDIEITDLEKKLFHFDRELISMCEDLAPQKLVSYLFSVAQLFNSYYSSTQILVEGDGIGNAHRLMIVKRMQEVLKKGLYILGINAPTKM